LSRLDVRPHATSEIGNPDDLDRDARSSPTYQGVIADGEPQ
jgi:hypothetical protein